VFLVPERIGTHGEVSSTERHTLSGNFTLEE